MRDARAAAIVAVAATLLVATPLRAETLGTLEVRVTDHRARIADFAALQVELAEVAVHPRGQPRGQGCVVGLRAAPAVDVVPLKDGRWARAGEAEVPAGRYDAGRVRLGAVRGALRSGRPAVVSPIGSTVALDLAVGPDRVAAVLVDLYVEDVSDHAADLSAHPDREDRHGLVPEEPRSRSCSGARRPAARP